MSEHIRVTESDGVLRIAMQRPEKKNALTRDMYAAIADALDRGAEDPGIRCVLIEGTEDCFSAGNDIGDFRARPANDGPAPTARVYNSLARYEKPVVASVGGLAIGIGTTLLLHCDLVYAATEARFRMPFVDLGVVPELGSSMLFPRLAGRHRTAELMLLGDFFDAATAHEIGLVTRVLPRAELASAAYDVAKRLAAKPPEALRQTKFLLRPDLDELMARIELERGMFAERLASPETQAIMANVLKR